MGLYSYHNALLQKALKANGMEMLFGSRFPTVVFKQDYHFSTSDGKVIAVEAGSIAKVNFFNADETATNNGQYRCSMGIEFPTHGSVTDIYCPVYTIIFYAFEDDMQIFCADNGLHIDDLLSVLKEDDETAQTTNCFYKAKNLYHDNARNYQSKMESIGAIIGAIVLFAIILGGCIIGAFLVSDVSIALKIAGTIGAVATIIGGIAFSHRLCTKDYNNTKEGKHYLYDATMLYESLEALDKKSCEAYRK